MGISLTSIHIFGTTAPEGAELSFRSFSPGWLTCVKDLSGKTPDASYQTAKRISGVSSRLNFATAKRGFSLRISGA